MFRVMQMPLLLTTVLSLVACASGRQSFRPTERVRAEATSGALAAEYDLGVEGRRWGEVRVWSDGAFAGEDHAPTRVHVGFEVENTLDVPMVLDVEKLRLEAVDSDVPVDGELAPIESPEPFAVPPHNLRTIDFHFTMPAGVDPIDLRGFRVHWFLHGPEDWIYEQHTGFVRERRERHDPWGPSWYFGPSFGAGYGFYWGG